MADCKVEWCDAEGNSGHGFCSAHYHRFMRHGDPLAGPRAPYGIPDATRFWLSVDKAGPGGCWLFRKGRKGDGYAQYNTRQPRASDPRKGVAVLAHRFAWELTYGEPPKGELDHLCYVRNCVNPAHLVESDRQDNIRRGNERRLAERQAFALVENLIGGFFAYHLA